MKRIIAVAFKGASAKNYYACADGEVASSANISYEEGEGSVTSSGSVGEPPAFPTVRFTLGREGVGGWQAAGLSLPSAVMAAPRYPNADGWGVRALEMLDQYRSAATRQGLFTAPFFVTCAYCRSDGSHTSSLPPVLMVPDSESPLVEGSADFTVETMKMTAVMAACRLRWRVSGVKELTDTSITHLDILVSDCVELYDRHPDPSLYHRVSPGNFCHYLSAEGVAGEEMIWSGTLPVAWQPHPRDDYEIALDMLKATEFRVASHIPVGELKDMDGFEDVRFNIASLSVLPSLPAVKPVVASVSSLGAMTPYANEPGWFPRWLFTSDVTSRHLDFVMDGQLYRVPLTRHPRLAGSYWWRGFDTRFLNPTDYLPTDDGSTGTDVPPGPATAVESGCYLETRPLKLGDAEERVRVMAVRLRGGSGDGSGIGMVLYGSDNLREWHILGSAQGWCMEGMWNPPCRFHRLRVTSTSAATLYVAAIEVEGG